MLYKNTPLTIEQYQHALAAWNNYTPPFSGSHINSCVTAAKTILLFEAAQHKKNNSKGSFNKRLTKYETEHNLRFVFNKSGKVSIHAHFPNHKTLGCAKLGEYPQLQLPDARLQTAAMREGVFQRHTTAIVIDAYEQSLIERNKTAPTKFGDNSLRTYQCRIKNLKKYLNLKSQFTSYDSAKIEDVLDAIIKNETNNQAIEQFANIRRIWKWAATKYNNDKNPAASIDDYYVSDRVETPRPCQAYTDLDSIAELWINLAGCPSIHQKNAVRFMILTGLRPNNIPQIKWEWLDSLTFPKYLTFPPSSIGERGAMKNQLEFKIPLTTTMREIILEQRHWVNNAQPNCSSEFVFLQPSNPFKPFAKRSLDKIMKDYSPVDAVKGGSKHIVVKGSAGAFCTMCRSFFKSNAKNQLIKFGMHKMEAEALTRMALHHVRKSDDPNGIHYDRSEQLFGTGTRLIFDVFKTHGANILARVKQIKEAAPRQTGRERKQEQRQTETQQKEQLRSEIKAYSGKNGYSDFISQKIFDSSESIKELMLHEEGRELIREYLRIKYTKAA